MSLSICKDCIYTYDPDDCRECEKHGGTGFVPDPKIQEAKEKK